MEAELHSDRSPEVIEDVIREVNGANGQGSERREWLV
jgi:hypothetical protein